MRGAYIAWNNLADAAVVSISGGQVAAGYPVTALQQRGLGSECRSAVDGTVFSIDFDLTNLPFDWLDQSYIAFVSGGVSAIAMQSDGKAVIGGSFTGVNGFSAGHVARVDADGIPELTFNPNANNTVSAIAIQPDGKIIIGGSFTTVAGTTRNRIARLNTDGTIDTGFNPNANSTVSAIAIQPDGKIIIGGTFTTVGGTGRNYVARLNSDGTIDTGFNPNANSTVSAIAIQSDGRILAGGSFTTIGGTGRNYVARLNASGTIDTGFNPNANSTVSAIAIQPDGQILAGGSFTTIGGTGRNRIARLYADGTIDTGFNPNTNNTVSAIAIQADGKIIIGGSFTTVAGTTRNRIARLGLGGELKTGYQPGSDAQVLSIAIQPDGGTLVGSLEGFSENSLVRLKAGRPGVIKLVSLRGISSGHEAGVRVMHRQTAGDVWTLLGYGRALPQPDGTTQGAVTIFPYRDVGYEGQIRIIFQGSSTRQVKLKRVWISDALVIPDGVDAQFRYGFRDSGDLDPSAGMQYFEGKGVRSDVLSVSLTGKSTKLAWGMDDGDAMISDRNNLRAMQREAGTTGEVIIIPRTWSDAWIDAGTVYGHVTSPWEIEHMAGPNWRCSFTVEQEL